MQAKHRTHALPLPRPAMCAAAITIAGVPVAGAVAESLAASRPLAAAAASAPANDSFKGSIASATGSFKNDHAAVLIVVHVVSSTARTRRLSLTLVPATCPTQTNCLRLTGTLAGRITVQPTIPDVGRRYAILGSGRVAPIGRVAATGTITTPGFIRQGREHLTLTLRTPRGAITLDALTPPVPGQSGP